MYSIRVKPHFPPSPIEKFWVCTQTMQYFIWVGGGDGNFGGRERRV